MQKNKNIIIVAGYFPPIGGAGAQRPLKFAKYLAKFGWKVTVVTTEPSTVLGRWAPSDSALAEELQKLAGDVNVIRAPLSETPRKFTTIDAFQCWSLSLVDILIERFKENGECPVLFTMSPFSLLRCAQILKERTGAPVYLDFRDPWVFDGWSKQKSVFHWWNRYLMTKKVVRAVDGVIANTPEARSVFIDRFKLDHSKVVTIENGYDLEDFEGLLEPEGGASGKFQVIFTGSLFADQAKDKTFYEWLKSIIRYGDEEIDPSGRSLFYFLCAIEELRNAKHPLLEEISVDCYGAYTEEDYQQCAVSKANTYINLHEYVPHSEVIKKIISADLLFLPLHSVPDGCRSRIVPGKLYEYLASGKPILGCVPEGDAKDILARYSRAYIAPPGDVDVIKNALLQAWNDHNKKKTTEKNEWVEKYERQNLTKRLEQFIFNSR